MVGNLISILTGRVARSKYNINVILAAPRGFIRAVMMKSRLMCVNVLLNYGNFATNICVQSF